MLNWNELLEKNEWIHDLKENPERYHAMMNNDADGLISAGLLRHYTGVRIAELYDFKTIYSNGIVTDTERIALDCGLANSIKQIDNHVQRYNSNSPFPKYSINPNFKISTQDNYFSKYAMSTAMIVLSIFSNWNTLTNEQKFLYLAVDSSYLGFYSDYYRAAWLDNFCTLFPYVTQAEITDFMEQHKWEIYYSNYKKSHNIGHPLTIVNGTLHTQICIEKIEKILGISLWLPNKTWCTSNIKFKYLQGYLDVTVGRNKEITYGQLQEKIKPTKLFSIAYTGRNHVCLTACPQN